MEIAVIGRAGSADTAGLLATIRKPFVPAKVVAFRDPTNGKADPENSLSLLANRDMVSGRAAVYICQNFACKKPMTDPEELATLLGAARPRRSKGSADDSTSTGETTKE